VTHAFRDEKRHSKSEDEDDDDDEEEDVISNAPRVLVSLHFERELFSSSQKSGGFAFFVVVVFFLFLVRDFERIDFHRVERQERNRLDATPGD
jgi:hypothetical protein